MISVKSPRGTWIQSISAANNKFIKQGTNIMVLDFSPETRYRAHLAERRSYAEAALTQLSDANIKSMASSLDDRYNSLAQSEAFYAEKLQQIKDGLNTGQFQTPDVMYATERLDRHRLAILKADARRKSFALDCDTAVRVLRANLDLIEHEDQYAADQIERLHIKAPVSGRLQLFADIGIPVKRGFVLCTIQ